MRTMEERTCPCGTVFYVDRWKAHRRRGLFCSATCAAAARLLRKAAEGCPVEVVHAPQAAPLCS
jgi:hypothetical protein